MDAQAFAPVHTAQETHIFGLLVCPECQQHLDSVRVTSLRREVQRGLSLRYLGVNDSSVQKAEREQKRGEHPNAKLQASEHLCCRGLGELVLTDVTFCEITGTLIHAQIYKYKH